MYLSPKEIISEFSISQPTFYRHLNEIPQIKKGFGRRRAIPKKREILEWIAERFLIDVADEDDLERKIQNLLK